MKSCVLLSLLFCLVIASCERNHTEETCKPGKGFEIYFSFVPYTDILNFDYSKLNLDTIALSPVPILQYKDLIKYDTLIHKLTLDISRDSLKIGDAGVRGRMFVDTIDEKPIYCGFKWPAISSVPCNWIYIAEPYKDLDHLSENELVISLNSSSAIDPRMDSRIINRLEQDGKIK